jgi:hypothetical protein
MHPSCVPIEAETLRRLYVDERLTTMKVAVRLACGATTVGRRLRQFGIPARPRGPSPGYAFDRGTAVPYHRSQWSPETAYVVGLIATDGNLSRNGRSLSITSKDRDLLETVRACLDLRTRMSPVKGGYGTTCYRVQWSDARFYRWLVGIGLTPAKSLTLGALAIPDEYFADFLRGCIDGDGCILLYTDRYHTTKDARYVYERLYVSLVSASRPFLEWIQTTARRLIGVFGTINTDTKGRPDRRPISTLRYAKAESIQVITRMYYAPEVPCLVRKRAKAERFLSPLGRARGGHVGRPRVGWLYNVTPNSVSC